MPTNVYELDCKNVLPEQVPPHLVFCCFGFKCLPDTFQGTWGPFSPIPPNTGPCTPYLPNTKINITWDRVYFCDEWYWAYTPSAPSIGTFFASINPPVCDNANQTPLTTFLVNNATITSSYCTYNPETNYTDFYITGIFSSDVGGGCSGPFEIIYQGNP